MEFPLSHQHHLRDSDEAHGDDKFEGRVGAENTAEEEPQLNESALREARDLQDEYDVEDQRSHTEESSEEGSVADSREELMTTQRELLAKLMPPPDYPIMLQIKNVSLDVTVKLPGKHFFAPGKKQERRLLSDINLLVKPGELLAIMGPTGCGKSTLLNVIGGRITKGIKGEVLFNGRPKSKGLKRHIAYVLQDDVLFPALTVQETIDFSARLRIFEDISPKEKKERVQAAIELLGLNRCKNTIVGDPVRRGVSGGERKRTNIGNEIITGPSLILLDEPTSGLDSYTAEIVLNALAIIAKETNRTVITTIHQPSSRIYEMFDKLLLMADGYIVYYGEARNASRYFAEQGYKCPPNYNPADFLLEVLAEQTGKSGARQRLIEAYKENHVEQDREEVERNLKELPDQPPVGRKFPSPWLTQLLVLTERQFKLQRARIFDINPLLQVLFVALISGLLWLQLPNEEARIRDRTAVIFFIAIFAGGFVPLLAALFSFPNERPVVNKERQSAAYQVSPYFLAKNISEMPLQLVYPTIFVCITYWMVGLNPDPGRFFEYLGMVLLANFCSASLGFLIGAFFTDMAFASLMASVMMLGLMLVGGFYVQLFFLEWWIKWTQYLSYLRYLYYALLEIDLVGLTFTQQAVITPFDGPSPITGTYILTVMGINTEPLDPWAYALIILGYALLFRFLAYLVIRFKYHPRS